ncbi:acyl-CoA/acyl-ACP dehydrogenase [Paraconexibacter antarcticus]|uniref:Acyl-CoA/acyl-ACP dehydrogenase n=1 Tax=Paraconexibacter antarcticus TaxID=2949664 RepID=A0ABY5DVP7_9ACTN|nr:acyl-CoA dehydrogenase family protein [Paraconexibacter antarcticus]UTI64767.1 acyl-CoA/acyl-ACP dehydrogenase [Paraconexibacter antarcticus]
MNLALSDEQEFLREAAAGALARVKTVEAAREALEDPAKLPDLWPLVKDAGWNGLLIDEEHGGAGLGAFDAMLVLEECGKVLAPTPLLGLLPATAILDAAGDESLAAVAAGDVRPAYVPARPPSDTHAGWSVDAVSGYGRPDAPRIAADGSVTGTVAWVPDAPGADLLVVVGVDESGAAAASVVEARAASVEAVVRYDATRALGHVTFDGSPGRRLDVPESVLAEAWYLAHALIASESLGTVQTTLAMSVEYAKERFTFGRAIGSYQSVKHELTEVLRQLENSRSLQFYAGWAGEDKPDEFALAASAFRNAAGHALDFAVRSNINVHGGIGATWEHDAPLFFRRAQLSKRLLGGTHDAGDRVAAELLAAAATPA